MPIKKDISKPIKTELYLIQDNSILSNKKVEENCIVVGIIYHIIIKEV